MYLRQITFITEIQWTKAIKVRVGGRGMSLKKGLSHLFISSILNHRSIVVRLVVFVCVCVSAHQCVCVCIHLWSSKNILKQNRAFLKVPHPLYRILAALKHAVKVVSHTILRQDVHRLCCYLEFIL